MMRNDRLLATIETSVNVPVITRLEQLAEQQLRDIEHFFSPYNQAKGREMKLNGRGGVQQAQRMFRNAVKRFESSKGE